MAFCNLHVHSSMGSRLDGASTVESLVQRAAELKQPAIASTEHGNMSTAVRFHKACKKHGIKHIPGIEVYQAETCRTVLSGDNAHLTLLAYTNQGYKNLLALSSDAYRSGFYRNPRTDYEMLAKYSPGIICLSGCLSSKTARAINPKDMSAAYEELGKLHQIFGDHLYGEIMPPRDGAQRMVNEGIIEMSSKMGIRLVATGDAHYSRKEDADMQDVLMCISTGARMSDKDRFALNCKDYYLKSEQEMLDELFEQPVHESGKIAELVEVGLDLGSRHFPVYEIPEERGPNKTEALFRLVDNGLKERCPGYQPGYLERVKHELSIIDKLGFNDYFLVVHDYMQWARKRGIMCSARGSGAGSLVCYCLYISNIDPIPHGLLFERFLSPQRREWPDIDTDVDQTRRDEIMMYLQEKYGAECVSQLATFGTMGGRSAIKDVARVKGYPIADSNHLASFVPELPGSKIKDAFDNPEFQNLYDNKNQVREIIDMAQRLEGTARNSGVHAAAIVIGDKPLVNYIPLARSRDGGVVTGFDMHDVEACGLPKFDLLGLRNLSVISECINVIEDTHGDRIDVYNLPNDPNVYSMLSSGGVGGVFQLDGSSGMRSVLERFQPTEIGHIAAIIAAYRPAMIDSGMLESYIRRRRGEEDTPQVHPVVDEILQKTYGHPIFQEQIMMLANQIGGIPMEDAYSLIKAISKKIREKVEAYKSRFYEGAKKSGLSKVAMDDLWSVIEAASRYSFNASHAYSYAQVAYQTAYLRHHYPVEFQCAILNSQITTRNFTKRDDLVETLEDCYKMGIRVKGPDINTSDAKFRVVDGVIIFGLWAVKGVSKLQAEMISRARSAKIQDWQFESIQDFYQRLSKKHVPRATLRNLIRVGACDAWPGTRAQLEDSLDRAIKLGAGEYKKPERVKLFKPDPPSPGDPLWLERDHLGFFLTGHPADEHYKHVHSSCTTDPVTFTTTPPNTMIAAGGIVMESRVGYTKNDHPYGAFLLEARGGTIQCMLWSAELKKYGPIVDDREFRIVKGRIDQRGHQRSLTVKRVVKPGDEDWKVSIKVSGIQPSEVLRIAAHYPGDHELLLEHAGNLARLKSSVQACPGLVGDIRDKGGEVELCL